MSYYAILYSTLLYSTREQCSRKTIYVDNTMVTNCTKDFQLFDFVLSSFNSWCNSWGVALTINYTK